MDTPPILDCLPLIKKYKQNDLILTDYPFKFYIDGDHLAKNMLNEDDDSEITKRIYNALYNLAHVEIDDQSETFDMFFSLVLIDYVIRHPILIYYVREEITPILNEFSRIDSSLPHFGLHTNPFYIWEYVLNNF